MHLLAIVLCVLLGFALSTQVRSRDSDAIGRMDETQLVSMLADLEQREHDLTAANNDLRAQIAELEDSANSAQAAREAAAKATQDALIIAGGIPVEGPGVVLWVAQGDDPIPASVFVTTMAELRNGGAEAIDLNGVRLGGRSWFSSDEVGIVVDGQPISSPYVWTAIGDSKTLVGALEIRGGSAAQFRAYGATVDTRETDLITIGSTIEPLEPGWAEIVPGS
ncbi:MAG: DUF881 domain-containing protein [Scrofimicrobium sp.]